MDRRARDISNAFNDATSKSSALKSAVISNLCQSNYDMIVKEIKLSKDPLSENEIVDIITNANL